MRNSIIIALLSVGFLFTSCSKESTDTGAEGYSDIGLAADGIGGSSGGAGGGDDGSQEDTTTYEAGLITAGEWNDLENWDFWTNLLTDSSYEGMPEYWEFYTNNKFSVLVQNNSVPVVNAKVELIRNNGVVWTARTDNKGKAVLWSGLYQEDKNINLSKFSLEVNDVPQSISLSTESVNEIELDASFSSEKVEICFIVDATGSMGDEIDFLKEDLKNVIQTVETQHPNLEIYTSSVFYRDEKEDYVTKKTGFTNNLDITINFIDEQNASGGGDFPEAVDAGLYSGVNDLFWSEDAKTRIAFLLLDAPPHHTSEAIENIQRDIEKAAEKGIKIIPITASGIDKETEFLMRYMAIATNGTYTFITNHSGIGGDHIEPSIGQYDVELLNELMIRLIEEYTD